MQSPLWAWKSSAESSVDVQIGKPLPSDLGVAASVCYFVLSQLQEQDLGFGRNAWLSAARLFVCLFVIIIIFTLFVVSVCLSFALFVRYSLTSFVASFFFEARQFSGKNCPSLENSTHLPFFLQKINFFTTFFKLQYTSQAKRSTKCGQDCNLASKVNLRGAKLSM